ncbi:unnamed protein product [Fraxinus pennsylvanica]|uniref:NAD-dependent epimerase/dehydratase domain-containing protein n=1 Tax=Fraxinus pennsylvanica TaxID=56036 RepID=A0AAD1Z862_9LAMI|nr:unnamed protein product [Fraxinus pennsylvanica]
MVSFSILTALFSHSATYTSFFQCCSYRWFQFEQQERKGKCKGKGLYASLFGVGAPEALVIGVVALLVFGPKGLAEVSFNSSIFGLGQGDGFNVRSYLYCEDVAEAFECVLHKGEVGHVYNIGTTKERRVIDVAKDICNLFNMDPDKSIQFVDNRPFNYQRYFLDDQKLKNLGWIERTTWNEGKYSSYFLRGTLKSLADMQKLPDEDFPFRKQLHECVGAALGAMGPKTFLNILPLKLDAQDLSEANLWLFPILKQYIVGANLSFFTKSILPMIGVMKRKSAIV